MLTLRKHKYIKRWRGPDGKYRYQYPSEGTGRPKKAGEKAEGKARFYDPVADWKENGIKSNAFKSWFGDWEKNPEEASKVVDSSGKPEEQYNTVPIKVYHGTADKNFRKFDPDILGAPDALLYGRGIYFTEDKEIAKEYMEKGQTPSRMYDLNKKLTEKDYDRVKDQIEDMPLGMKRQLHRDNFHEDMIGLIRTWEGLLGTQGEKIKPVRDLKESLGVELEQTASPGIFEVFLNIRRPFDLDNDSIPIEKVPKAKENYEKRRGSGSAKDVNLTYRQTMNYMDPKNRKKKGLANKTGKSELNKALQEMGYDGMTHIGGWNMGTRGHRVWIAFEPTQIKSTDNKGTFSEESGDITKSKDEDIEGFREHLRQKGEYQEDRDKGKQVDPRELKSGIEVEYEHTDDREVARQIALDHLMEDPKYYTKLKKYVETNKSLMLKAKYISRWRDKDGKWRYEYPSESESQAIDEPGESQKDDPEEKSEYQLNQALNMPYSGIAVADGLEEHGIQSHEDLKEAIKKGDRDKASSIFRSIVDKVKETGLPKATVNQTIDAAGKAILQLKNMYTKPKHRLTTKVKTESGGEYYKPKKSEEEDPLTSTDPAVSASRLKTARKRLGGWSSMASMPTTSNVRKMMDQGTAELKKGTIEGKKKWYVKGRQRERANNIWIPFQASEKGVKVNIHQRKKTKKNYRTTALVEATIPWPYARSFIKHHVEGDQIKKELLGQMERSKGYKKYFKLNE